MLGLGVPRRVVTEQRQIIGDIASKTRNADETTLLDVAGALLYVEASLDDHIDRLGGEEPQSEDAAVQMELPKAEVRKILDALMKEASVNIAQAKQDIVAFIESPWDHAKVEQIPRLLEEISGALRMLDLTEPAGLMTGDRAFSSKSSCCATGACRRSNRWTSSPTRWRRSSTSWKPRANSAAAATIFSTSHAPASSRWATGRYRPTTKRTPIRRLRRRKPRMTRRKAQRCLRTNSPRR
jgi:hypothetical protein